MVVSGLRRVGQKKKLACGAAGVFQRGKPACYFDQVKLMKTTSRPKC